MWVEFLCLKQLVLDVIIYLSEKCLMALGFSVLLLKIFTKPLYGKLWDTMSLSSMSICHSEKMDSISFTAVYQVAVLIGLAWIGNKNSLSCSETIFNLLKQRTSSLTLGFLLSLYLFQFAKRLSFCGVVAIIQVVNQVRFTFAVCLGSLYFSVSWMEMLNLRCIRWSLI